MITTGGQNNSKSGERACTLTARDIADIVSGELRGDESAMVSGIAPIDRASPNDVSFVTTGRYASMFRDTKAGIVLVTSEFAEAPSTAASRVIVARPQEAMLELLPRLYPEREKEPSVSASARIGRGATLGARVSLDANVVIADGASIGEDVWIGAGAVIGEGVRVGAQSRIYPNVTVYAGTQIGERVRVHSGCVLGSDGFGYVFRGGAHNKIPHVGRCIIGNDVEIGANTTIDRGSIDDTIVGDGTKIDNLVQLGHNVKIGRLCLIMAQVGIAGSTRVGDGCVLAGQAGIGGHLTIGDGARIAGQAGVFGDVPAGESWSGYPARPHRESLRASGAVLKLPDILKKLERILEEKNQS